jgi:hypothetical protein
MYFIAGSNPVTLTGFLGNETCEPKDYPSGTLTEIYSCLRRFAQARRPECSVQPAQTYLGQTMLGLWHGASGRVCGIGYGIECWIVCYEATIAHFDVFAMPCRDKLLLEERIFA